MSPCGAGVVAVAAGFAGFTLPTVCDWPMLSNAAVTMTNGRNIVNLLPIDRSIVLQELTPDVLAGIDAGDDGIDDACGAVDDVERRMEAMFGGLARGDLDRIFVGDPAGIDAVHVNAVQLIVRRRRARHHVQ